jgi:hypothetical protein
MSSSAEDGLQIVAVVTKLIGNDLQVEFLVPNQNPSFIHTVEARSKSVGRGRPRGIAKTRRRKLRKILK